MERKDFIKLSTLFGIGLPFSSVFAKNLVSDYKNQKIIIIGAGAAGLSCAYFLTQLGVDFELLEASSECGGRMKHTTTFTDFPIPLGAEWIHSRKDVFSQIVNEPGVSVEVETKAYGSDTRYAYISNGKMSEERARDKDLKFVGSSWFDFFEKHITPKVKDKIALNTLVKFIDYSKDEIIVKTNDRNYTGNKVVVTVPVKVLQDNDIQFSPKLPLKQREAINNIKVWEGFKAFFEFKEKFYHTATEYKIRPKESGQKLYYDAAYGQRSDKNILGLFTVGVCAKEFYDLTDEAVKEKILQELDDLYDGKASKNYVKHITQNWGKEPFIKAAYVHDFEDWKLVEKLGKQIQNKVYFAGGAYTDGEDWENVHTAALSAKKVAEKMFA